MKHIEVFTTHTCYFCQWEHGAKEYFSTLDEAIAKAKTMYERNSRMTDENFEYWIKQKSIIGKEVIISQVIDIVSFTHSPAFAD